ncbi:MAG: hypothetical protein ACYC7E_00165 [Armatimonadota bacterium]
MSEVPLPNPVSEEAKRFVNFARKLLSIPKAEIDAKEQDEKARKPRRKSA